MTCVELDVRGTLQRLLASRELDFHGERSSYGPHTMHAFAAKFPPQLPRLFISELTAAGETVLDPMVGSGTTLVEAALLGRRGVGVDIDPLALLICQVKTTPPAPAKALQAGEMALMRALARLRDGAGPRTFDASTRAFIDYWFAPETQCGLTALLGAIEEEGDPDLRRFLLLLVSSIIVTKSGGVSLARDLAHSRPHKDQEKVPRGAVDQFRARLTRSVRALEECSALAGAPTVQVLPGDCRQLPVDDRSVDLVVTSPPYANAIDYMRAHKFSLVWLGEPVGRLAVHRSTYIGAERLRRDDAHGFPALATETLRLLERRDPKKAAILAQYFADMRDALAEMARVLRPGRAAVVVVGPSTMRGLRIDTARCLAEIGQSIGLEAVGIGHRKLDRDRRMMPARAVNNGLTLIEMRIHEEHVIGFLRP